MESMVSRDGDDGRVKYVFVCGLPRSGTSVIGRNIARLENCTGLHDTGVLDDEGGFLQNVYPTEDTYGGPGRFGFDPRAHLTETSALLTPDNVAKLRESWHPYWDNSKTIFVEKTPANLLMTRFLQAAFPNSYLVVIKRHPIAVGLAAQKWKVNVTSLYNMFEHWLHCHALYEQDKQYLKRVYELKYEDYVENPDKYHAELAAFIGTRIPERPRDDQCRTVLQWPEPNVLLVPERTMEEASAYHNKKYFDRWYRLLTNSPFKGYYRYIARTYEPKFDKYGYSLTKGFGLGEEALEGRGKVSDAVGAFYCHAADACAFLGRLSARSHARLRVAAKAVLPEFVVTEIRQARKKNEISEARTQKAATEGGKNSEVRG
jgi:sulfotransferase family protein